MPPLTSLARPRPRGLALLAAACAALFAFAGTARAVVITPMSQFSGTFTSIAPWSAAGGGAQCGNYGTPSINGRLRGNLSFATVAGVQAGVFALPADPNPSSYPLEVCDVNDGLHPLALPADVNYGLSVYIPSSFTIPNRTGYVNIGEFHFSNVGGQPPLCLLLRNDRVQLSILGGAYSTTTGFQYSAGKHNVPTAYAIPPGALTYGAWNEITFHVHWAADGTGNAQFYYRAKGQPTWQAGSAWSGIPTITWTAPNTFAALYTDNVLSYGTAMTQPFSLNLANELIGSSLASVQAQMP